MRILVLGGTAEARTLASLLVGAGVDVESSLAGRVREPRLPQGRVRVGGFGGVDGLAAHAAGLDAVVDATHPFATRISANAALACERAGVPLLRLLRPGWADHPRAETWHWVPGYEQARQRADDLGGRPFLTTGRQSVPHFGEWAERDVLIRVVEPMPEAPPAWTVLIDRGPYDVTSERNLLGDHRARVLLTKDSGGSYTSAKLEAAAQLGIPVVVVSRPPVPAAVASVADAAAVLQRLNLPLAGEPPGVAAPPGPIVSPE